MEDQAKKRRGLREYVEYVFIVLFVIVVVIVVLALLGPHIGTTFSTVGPNI